MYSKSHTLVCSLPTPIRPPCLTCLTCLTSLTAGVASSLHCVLELDNSRLVTQSVTRSSNPVWNKQFVLMVRDMTSCLAISVLDRERNMKTHLLARLSLPLLSLAACRTAGLQHSRTFRLKDKQLRLAAKGNSPELDLEWRLDWDVVKAALVSVTPREELVMNRTEKFKRRLLREAVTVENIR